MCKIITINGVSQNEKENIFINNNEELKEYKQVFYVRTKEEIEEKINEIVKKSDAADLKLLIFANKKYTGKCTEVVEYDSASGYPKMYKDFMKFTGLCEKYIYEGETIAVIIESVSDVEDMCDSFDQEVADRTKTNIRQSFDKMVSLQNFYITFRIETEKLY